MDLLLKAVMNSKLRWDAIVVSEWFSTSATDQARPAGPCTVFVDQDPFSELACALACDGA